MRAVLIDDERGARTVLKTLLKTAAPEVKIVGEGDDVDGAVEVIRRTKPDLVFLDIQLRSGTGFDVLEQLADLPGEVIFVTAYDDYAIRAFECAAFGYLLKPVRVSDLQTVMARYKERRQAERDVAGHLRVLIEHYADAQVKKLVVQNVNGFRVLGLNEILYLQGEVNYTRFVLDNGEQLMTSRTLKTYEQILGDFGFYRAHQSHILNLRYVAEYQKGDGGCVVMTNGDVLDVSRRRKAGFLEKFLA